MEIVSGFVPYATGSCIFANVCLPVWNSPAALAVAEQIPLDYYWPFDTERWYQFELAHLNLSSPYKVQDPPRPGTLVWPVGASHWAYATFVVNEQKLNEIRLAVGAANTRKWLVLADTYNQYTAEYCGFPAGSRQVSAEFRMLPPRPLLVGQDPDPLSYAADKLWVMTLVDERYFWWNKLVTISGAPTWDDYFLALAAQLGIPVIDTPDIPDAYLKPTERFNVKNVPGGLVLDAAAATVGLRVARSFDGQTVLYQWRAALTNEETLWDCFADCDAKFPPHTHYGGWGRVMGGGLLANADIVRSVPANLRVVFGRRTGVSGTVLDGHYTLDRPLSGYTGGGFPYGFNLAGEYGTGTVGMPGYSGRFTADAYASYNATGGITNAETLSALANRAGYDWYGWRLGNVDVEIAGVVPWQLDAHAHRVTWTYDEDRVTTRVAREPYFDVNHYGFYPHPEAAALDLMLVVLTAKQHALGPFIAYNWRRIIDDNSPAALTYTWHPEDLGGITPGGEYFGLGPAYQEQNVDLPVFTLTGNPVPECAVWIRRGKSGAGPYWFVEHDPRWEYVEIDPNSTVSAGFVQYYAGYLLRYNQDTKQFNRYQNIYVRRTSQVPLIP